MSDMDNQEQALAKDLTRLLAKVVKRSGFPFQAKIQRIIESISGWEVIGTECPWKYDNREEFLDIVARKNKVHLVIECKKSGVLSGAHTKNGIECFEGAPKRSFVFLCTESDGNICQPTVHALLTYCREENHDDTPLTILGTQAKLYNVEPSSYEASLCVTADLVNPKEMLEREVADLVRGTHEFANVFYSFLHEVEEDATAMDLFIPVYVTTAPIFVLGFDPETVSVLDGEFELDPHSLVRVPWMRFRKTLMAGGTFASDDRTVFVIEAKHFKEFLEKFEVTPAKEM
jgi:hypothetical protein